jgi:putative phosphoesterase
MLVGILSDTHGLMRPEGLDALSGSNLIIHAGDVGAPEVLEKLRGIAPVFAVRGNVDTQAWADQLPNTQIVPVGVHKFYVLHNISDLAVDPVEAGVAAVVFGHSHKPSIETRNGVLYLNPGSAGPRRFKLPICVARVEVSDTRIEPAIIALDIR